MHLDRPPPFAASSQTDPESELYGARLRARPGFRAPKNEAPWRAKTSRRSGRPSNVIFLLRPRQGPDKVGNTPIGPGGPVGGAIFSACVVMCSSMLGKMLWRDASAGPCDLGEDCARRVPRHHRAFASMRDQPFNSISVLHKNAGRSRPVVSLRRWLTLRGLQTSHDDCRLDAPQLRNLDIGSIVRTDTLSAYLILS